MEPQTNFAEVNDAEKPKTECAPVHRFVHPRITFTGVDERTNLSDLPRGVEYGVLFTVSPDGRNRYPSRKNAAAIMAELSGGGHAVALHVCGARARAELVNGQLMDLTAWPERIQVNGRLEPWELEDICHHHQHEIITQANEWNTSLLDLECDNHAILVDASGGRGRSPSSWARPQTDKTVGFAGGLGPDNVADELRRIRDVAIGDWWIDMEGKLRDHDDWFDVSRVRAVLCAVFG